ncbi:MAG: hypothetical protein HOC20_05970 [Chloroflexi bacterium]|jgi:hypothetical protein|nr:hypothetical protein [Chloroflexota bacterium]
MNFEANCRTTAMGVMPHKDHKRALELALNLDIPYWPQLPRITFSEDMFAQLADGFPGTMTNHEDKYVSFNTERFFDDLANYSAKMDDPSAFSLNGHNSMTYHHYLDSDFSTKVAIRGQLCGPVNFGFRVTDEEKKPIIYNDDVRALLFDFAQKKVNAQYQELVKINSNAFVWVDEPGLGWVFNSFSGYNELRAQEDYRYFLDGFEGPRALHLCLNVHLPYLFGLGLDILSIDAFQFETMPRGYAEDIAQFLNSGGIMSWGIVPTESVTLDPESPETLFNRLVSYWEVIAENSDISTEKIARQALIAPSKCCIKNAVMVEMDEASRSAASCTDPQTEESLVERAFTYLKTVSEMMRDRFKF